MGGAGEKEMRATSEREEREKRETEEIIRTRERATVHVPVDLPAYIISICNLVKHSYLNNSRSSTPLSAHGRERREAGSGEVERPRECFGDVAAERGIDTEDRVAPPILPFIVEPVYECTSSN